MLKEPPRAGGRKRGDRPIHTKAKDSHQGSSSRATTGSAPTWAWRGWYHLQDTGLLPPGTLLLSALPSAHPKQLHLRHQAVLRAVTPPASHKPLHPPQREHFVQVRQQKTKIFKCLARSMTEGGTRTTVSVFLFLKIQCFTQNEGLVVLGEGPRTCFVGSITQSI